jgi:5-methylcytosine-specific restriction endonuclease McrA
MEQDSQTFTIRVKKSVEIKVKVPKIKVPEIRIPEIRVNLCRLLRKLIHWKQLDDAEKKIGVKRGANFYAFQYMKLNAGKYVKIKDVSEYANKKTQEKTGSSLGDPPRSFEILRKDKLPLEWHYITYKKNKWVIYSPNIKKDVEQKIIDAHKHKGDSFSASIILQQMELSNHKCCITGIPAYNGDLAADHFIPKEKGGESVIDNCVIINKILNEKKNNKMPIEWFCESLLSNFMAICRRTGILQECKEKLIEFIQGY